MKYEICSMTKTTALGNECRPQLQQSQNNVIAEMRKLRDTNGDFRKDINVVIKTRTLFKPKTKPKYNKHKWGFNGRTNNSVLEQMLRVQKMIEISENN